MEPTGSVGSPSIRSADRSRRRATSSSFVRSARLLSPRQAPADLRPNLVTSVPRAIDSRDELSDSYAPERRCASGTGWPAKIGAKRIPSHLLSMRSDTGMPEREISGGHRRGLEV